MSNILDRILDVKREELIQARQHRPLHELRAAALALPPCRDFYRAIAQPPTATSVNVIAEIKRASPSAGLIRPDFDPVQLAQTYQAAGAAAISVLTDEQFFQGHLDFLAQVRAAVSLPLLRKDFIIDAYHVYEARAAGADAILLIAEALAPDLLLALRELAVSLGMSVLVEVHSTEALAPIAALARFPAPDHCLLGVNNRDLKRMAVDLQTSVNLAGRFPTGTLGLVGESGIKTRTDVDTLAAAGFSGVLIGETLMRADNIAQKFTELFAAS